MMIVYMLHHNYDYRTYVMELSYLLTRSSLTYPQAASKIYHDTFFQLMSSVSLPWVIYFKAFNLERICIPKSLVNVLHLLFYP